MGKEKEDEKGRKDNKASIYDEQGTVMAEIQ